MERSWEERRVQLVSVRRGSTEAMKVKILTLAVLLATLMGLTACATPPSPATSIEMSSAAPRTFISSTTISKRPWTSRSWTVGRMALPLCLISPTPVRKAAASQPH
jgi:hypothetical protein